MVHREIWEDGEEELTKDSEHLSQGRKGAEARKII